MSYKAVIFDWDGTVVDSADHITDCLLYASGQAGLPPLDRSSYKNIIGLGLMEALNTLYPGIEQDQILTMREAYSKRFIEKATTPEHIFPGMIEILRDLGLDDRQCAVATGKSRRGLDRAFRTTELQHYFSASRCADETRSKPDPAMLKELLGHYGLEPRDAVMIGDTSYDLEMARRIDMPAIGVHWGVHDPDTLKKQQPVAIVETMDDLRQALRLI